MYSLVALPVVMSEDCYTLLINDFSETLHLRPFCNNSFHLKYVNEIYSIVKLLILVTVMSGSSDKVVYLGELE